MFESLRKKWKVSGIQLALIITTFALGGSLTGFVGKKIMNQLALSQDWLWTIIYILLVTLLWPVSVLLVSIPFGQFRFFSLYIKRIGKKLGFGNNNSPVVRIAIFASGAGSNAQKIIDYFRNHPHISVSLIICNNPSAGVLKIAEKENIKSILVNRDLLKNEQWILELKGDCDFIVLAGFLWKLPSALVKAFENHIINIHPALLPKYGGKGMYGANVHQSVLIGGDKETGITIHYVDEVYDNGKIIFQARCPVMENDSVETLTARIHSLEHAYYPKVIEEVIMYKRK